MMTPQGQKRIHDRFPRRPRRSLTLRPQKIRIDLIQRIWAIVLGILFAMAALFPMTPHIFGRPFDLEPVYLWDIFSLGGPENLAEFMGLILLAFPVVAIPLLLAGAFVRSQAARLGCFGVAFLFQCLPYFFVSVLAMSEAGSGEGSLEGGLYMAAFLGAVAGVTVGTSAAVGLALGVADRAWRWAAAAGGAGCAAGALGLGAALVQTSGNWLLALSMLGLGGAAAMSFASTTSARHRASFAQWSLAGYALTGLGLVTLILYGTTPSTEDLWFFNWVLRMIGGFGLGSLFVLSLLQFFSPAKRPPPRTRPATRRTRPRAAPGRNLDRQIARRLIPRGAAPRRRRPLAPKGGVERELEQGRRGDGRGAQ